MRLIFLIVLLVASANKFVYSQINALVFQSDFGLKDGAVAAMKGVAYGVSDNLKMFDLTHEIPPYNVWEAAYRLNQSAPYWLAGTVFVSVVDPGVGSKRKSIVLKTKTGHYFVTPDNGTITLIAETLGVEEVREIDEVKNRLKNSSQSYTFHGRDVYAYTGARLAAKTITFKEVGPLLTSSFVKLPYQKSKIVDGKIYGAIDVLDIQYGNVWTNIPKTLLDKLNVQSGNKINILIAYKEAPIHQEDVMFGNTFNSVPEGESIAYINSLMNFSLGINMGNYANKHKIASGPGWTITLTKL